MGVEGLKNFFLRKGFGNSFIKELPKPINSVFIDCNGIFHIAAGKTYHLPDDKDDEETAAKKLSERKKLAKKSKKVLEKLHIKKIIEIFENIIDEYKPSENLILAVDGIANSAKLNQQKPRRFKKALESNDPTILIDTNCITPGTNFMIKLDFEIEKWLDSYEGFKPHNIIYSSHLSPGEGEHKIFDYIRRGELNIEGNSIIIGMDNDLIILSMLSGLDNFYLVPERKEEKGNVLNINSLKNQIKDKMKFEDCNEDILIKDFSVLIMLNGNDFLHKFPNVGRLENLVPFLFLIYSKFLKKHLTDKNNKIIWSNYLQLLMCYENYKIKNGKGQKYLEVYLKKIYKINYPELEESILVKDKSGKIINQIYDYKKHDLVFDEKKFSEKWYKKQFNKDILQYDLKIIENHENKDIVKMCINYLQMVQWVQFYYTEGFEYVSNLEFYHYTYNPLMGSVVKVLKLLLKEKKINILYNVLRKKDKIDITVVHQLMAVIPPQSLDLIQEQYRKIYKKDLGQINVENFKISKEATWKDHQGYPILPPINIELIDKSLRKKKFVLPKELMEKEDIIYKTE